MGQFEEEIANEEFFRISLIHKMKKEVAKGGYIDTVMPEGMDKVDLLSLLQAFAEQAVERERTFG